MAIKQFVLILLQKMDNERPVRKLNPIETIYFDLLIDSYYLLMLLILLWILDFLFSNVDIAHFDKELPI